MLLHATKRLYGSLRLLQTVLRSTSNESFARTDWFEIPGTADVGSEVWELNVGTVLGQLLEPQHLTCSFEMILDTQPIGRHMDAVLSRHRQVPLQVFAAAPVASCSLQHNHSAAHSKIIKATAKCHAADCFIFQEEP